MTRITERNMFDKLQQYHPHFHKMRSTKNDKYCSYDAHTDKYVIEFKARRKYYPTTQIEKSKYDRLMKENRIPLYVIYSSGKMYVFNLKDLTNNKYNFKWTSKMCPKTTDFFNNKFIKENVGEICWKQAKAVINMEN